MNVHFPLLLLLLFSTCLEARTYQVEVVVFSNRNTNKVEEETFLHLESLPNFESENLLIRPAENNEESKLDLWTVTYQVLPDKLKKLNIESKFKINPNLNVMFSEGWNHGRPEGESFEYVFIESDPISIFSDENNFDFQYAAKLSKAFTVSTIATLQGLVGIRVSQLLYVDLDLVFGSKIGLVRMKESRKIKLNELNYFDHPLFGVLVMVSPVDSDSENN